MGLVSPWFDTMIREGGVTVIQVMPSVPGQARSVGAVIGGAANKSAEAVLKLVFAVLPGFSHYNPVPSLVSGRMVQWSLVTRAMFWYLIVRGGLVAVLGVWLFHRRELARVQV
jgi:hypothetical protein